MLFIKRIMEAFEHVDKMKQYSKEMGVLSRYF
ncbi:hypothetical protein BCE_1024 [Bacillus cereus ATCC 10987]|uniref:Uncharacterized protein n=1 Tax=Bacillus cereus (strain ATCC 10987 / NRS 248) TaxID=222523 RepID=Q73CP1_BACC1|nr:hypothetical protein BCE_1024 [Bacillus cereus ATCC 10987]